MPPSTILCPGGAASQSGTAVKERYPETQIDGCESIPKVLELLDTGNGPFVIPIWNSHEGEVLKASYFWDSIQKQSIKIEDAWAKPIDFWYVRRSGVSCSHGLVGSVEVAGTQCSEFLKMNSFELVKCALTTTAFERYTNGEKWDGVLVAPGQGNLPGFEVIEKTTANTNNFTSFVRIVPTRAFNQNTQGGSNYLTGVQMRAFDFDLGSAEVEFFERLLNGVSDISKIPKLIFVFNRDSKVGMLFEGTRLYAGDLLNAEELESDSISIYEEAGETTLQYSTELESLFASNFPLLTGKDFFEHTGVKTCLFGCPPLGLYTHGYEPDAVRPVFKFYISNLFSLWDDDLLKCTDEQQQFFERHRESWLEKRSEFVEFETVGVTT